MPGVNLGEGAVLGLASVATCDLEPWSVNVGVPARKVKVRLRQGQDTDARARIETDEIKCE
jgi:putative colanic acid biosynthesis acetyltransferase WcaF